MNMNPKDLDLAAKRGDILQVRKSTLKRWAWLAGLLALLGFALFLGTNSAALEAPNQHAKAGTAQQPEPSSKAPTIAKSDESMAVTAPISGAKGYHAIITAFSDVECGSAWCNRHEPKDGQIAINYAKFGRHATVYIPAFDKTYRVVGTTDGNTDADIWFSDDRDAALNFGRKTLLINFVD